MDRLQFNNWHLDGWVRNVSEAISYDNVFSIHMEFEIVDGELTNGDERVWFIPDESRTSMPREFQGNIQGLRVTQQTMPARHIGMFSSVLQEHWGTSRRTLNVDIVGAVYREDYGFDINFVNTNYTQISNSQRADGQRLDRIQIAVREQKRKQADENKFEPEGRNRLKQIEDFDIIKTNGENMSKIELFSYLNLEEVGSVLSEESEPGRDDITELIEVASKMPRREEDIEDFAAPFVASISLNALFRCNELKTKATVYAGNKKIDLDAEYGRLIENSDKPATITKEISKSKPSYIKAAKDSDKAKAYVEFYTGLSANFEKCHYWAKSREIANNQEFKGSAYEPHDARTSVKSNEGDVLSQSDTAFQSSRPQKLTQVKPVEDFNL